MSYKLLSEPIRKYIRNQRWESLRPIQAAAISKILSTNSNYILASRTASGKTEAAFLPILSKVDFNQPGVQVLYISPLIALINDQFFRIEDLCKDLEIRVTKWHGEASRSLKTRLIRNPSGIVLITPESIEAMFVNAPYNISRLFGNLNYIVIDEIHSFLGVDRGIQLMSLLSRIQQINDKKLAVIGLSATIGDYNYTLAKELTGDTLNTKILLDRSKKETEAKFKYFHNSTAKLSLDLLKDLYKETCYNKALVFRNSRGRTEEVAVSLRRISDKLKGHKFYYSHHSSVDKEIRESIELFAKHNQRFNFCISCTSTLELGIDIGTVDKIVQIDSTHSVASLVQRIGRSGRREGEKSIVDIYATEKWSLLQSLACWQLYKIDFIEPINSPKKPYDILLHQMLSIAKQLSGCRRNDLIHRIKTNHAFSTIAEKEINSIIDEAIDCDYLEVIQNEISLGVEGEKIVNTKEFYSVFKTEPSFKVLQSGKKIGNIPFSAQVKINENIFLAAKIWKIKDIDFNGSKIFVTPARDGKKPIFFGMGGNIHPKIRDEMLRILKSDDSYTELDQNSNTILAELRHDFKDYHIQNYKVERPIINREDKTIVYTFTGTKINRSLAFLISNTGRKVQLKEYNSTIEIEMDLNDSMKLVQDVNAVHNNIDSYLEEKLKENESLIGFSKWGSYLPMEFKCSIIKERYFDFESALNFIENIKFIEPE